MQQFSPVQRPREAPGVTGLLGVEKARRKAVVVRQSVYFLFSEAARVARAVPVEIGYDRSLSSQTFVPEALEEIPVDEALNVIAAAFDAQGGNIRRIELDIQRAQAPAQLGELLRHGP